MVKLKQSSVLDFHYLLKELQNKTPARIDNFYLQGDSFYIKIYNSQIRNKYLKFILGTTFYLTDKKEETTYPSSFVLYLRKNYKNHTLKEINLYKGNRTIDLKITKQEETTHILIELFNKGNIIVTDENYIIKNILFNRKYKDLILKKNERYAIKEDETETNYTEFIKIEDSEMKIKLLKKLNTNYKNSDLQLIKFFALKLRIGGKYAEELCRQIQIDKKTTEYKFCENFIKEFKKFLTRKLEPYNILKNNQIIDFIPFKFQTYKNNIYEFKKTETFNKAIEQYYEQIKTKIQQENKKEKKIDKLKKRLEQQKEYLKEIEQKIKELNLKGDKIYENYSKIEETLQNAKKVLKKEGINKTKEYLFKESPLKDKIKKIDIKNLTIELEF